MKHMTGKLNNKTALITGGSSGIGLATAILFAQQGAHVAITGRKQESLDAAVKAIGHDAIGIQGDVASLSDLDRLYSTVSKKLGKIDILVANAAVYVLSPLAGFTEAMYDTLSDINVKGTFFTVQKALPYLNDGASVILTSSTVAEKGIPNHSVYAASKAAIRSFARSFSVELLDRKIRVNVLSPGPVDTPVFETITPTREEAEAVKTAMAQFTPVKRIASGAEIAAANLYLASDESAYMVGAEILIDGGIRSL
jgi:NAD(P)-dependent dehydrogenase (short-subunit alcohol dehydrogenase family)